MSDTKQLNSEAHRWAWKLVMDTFKAHKKANETPIPRFAHVIAGDIARSVAERIEALEAENAELRITTCVSRAEAAEAALEEVPNDLQDILSAYSRMTRAKIRLQLEDMRDELEAALKEVK